MEYIDGVSLSQMVKGQGALPEAKALAYVRKVADAVGYMHSLSMNHLDLKPANIMVRATDDEPILIDFGLSKQYDASGGQTSTTPIGISHGFAPIEQYRPGGVATFTPQTDIYALGATLFNLLSGTVPPHYSEILEDGLSDLPASVSQRCRDAVGHAMEIKKNRRPDSITVFLSELGNATVESDSHLSQDSRPQQKATKIPASKTPDMEPQSSLDATMMIGDIAPRRNVSAIDETITIEGLNFIDLGLSVKWADLNIGASDIDEAGHFFAKRMDGNLTDLYQWNTQGAIVPTIAHFKELIENCRWHWGQIKDSYGYRISGQKPDNVRFIMDQRSSSE